MDGCEDSLTAMPGDIILFYCPEDGCDKSAVVKTAGWRPDVNGGKIWTYETKLGTFVPHTRVQRVEKVSSGISEEVVSFVGIEKNLPLEAYSLEKSEIEAIIECVNANTKESLLAARYLIDRRINRMKT